VQFYRTETVLKKNLLLHMYFSLPQNEGNLYDFSVAGIVRHISTDQLGKIRKVGVSLTFTSLKERNLFKKCYFYLKTGSPRK
jgi:hypothetical protein